MVLQNESREDVCLDMNMNRSRATLEWFQKHQTYKRDSRCFVLLPGLVLCMRCDMPTVHMYLPEHVRVCLLP